MNNDNLYPQLQTQRPLAPSQQDKLDKAEAERKLQQAVVGTRQVLFDATTVFPFTLFPDTVIVDREKTNRNTPHFLPGRRSYEHPN